jgi:hypothetical protein
MQVRAGRMKVDEDGGGSRLVGTCGSKPIMLRDRSLVNVGKHVAIASGEICTLLVIEIFERWSSTRSLADERKLSRVGNWILAKWIFWSIEADPPKNASVMTNLVSASAYSERERKVRTGND